MFMAGTPGRPTPGAIMRGRAARRQGAGGPAASVAIVVRLVPRLRDGGRRRRLELRDPRVGDGRRPPILVGVDRAAVGGVEVLLHPAQALLELDDALAQRAADL